MGLLCFSDRILTPQGPIRLYGLAVSVAVPLVPFRASPSAVCPSLFVEPFPFNDLKLHVSHSPVAIQKNKGKESEGGPKGRCPFCWVFTVDCRLNTKASEKPKKRQTNKKKKHLHPVQHRHIQSFLSSFLPRSSRTVRLSLSECADVIL